MAMHSVLIQWRHPRKRLARAQTLPLMEWRTTRTDQSTDSDEQSKSDAIILNSDSDQSTSSDSEGILDPEYADDFDTEIKPYNNEKIFEQLNIKLQDFNNPVHRLFFNMKFKCESNLPPNDPNHTLPEPDFLERTNFSKIRFNRKSREIPYDEKLKRIVQIMCEKTGYPCSYLDFTETELRYLICKHYVHFDENTLKEAQAFDEALNAYTTCDETLEERYFWALVGSVRPQKWVQVPKNQNETPKYINKLASRSINGVKTSEVDLLQNTAKKLRKAAKENKRYKIKLKQLMLGDQNSNFTSDFATFLWGTWDYVAGKEETADNSLVYMTNPSLSSSSN